MAGLPWLVVFALLAWFAARRGWGFAYGLFVFCMGVVAAGGFGDVVAGAVQNLLAGTWSGIVSLLNSALG
jgi:hypothetical protein